jgi:CubicO group peptidase (beta-lactamase class C family)
MPIASPAAPFRALETIRRWPVPNAVAVVVLRDGTVAGAEGETDRPYPLASVTKLLTAWAALVAWEEGAFELDDPAGPEGSTVRHLLAHASGLAFDERRAQAAPGERRIYSNAGFEVLAEHVAATTGMPFTRYLREAVLEPLGMTATELPEGATPAAGAVSTAADLALFAAEVQSPRLLHPSTLETATTVAYPGLRGVLPGYGPQRPNDWGLGLELRDGKAPHWTGAHSSPRTYGHFGQSGTFLWADPEAGAACVVLTDRAFGPWAHPVWPALTDAILAELAARDGE